MSRPVLCAVDINETVEDNAVLDIAAKLAALDGAELDVITVVPDYGTGLVSGYFSAEHHSKVVAEAKTRLKGLVKEVTGPETSAKVRHLVATGNIYEEILKAAEAYGAGLIVIGAHKPDFKDYLLGPNAARVVRHAQCSVHVVR